MPVDFKKVAIELNNNCGQGFDNRCFKNYFSSFAKTHQFADSQNLLEELQKINPETRYCHSIAHAISIAEVQKDPKNWLKVFSYVPEMDCSYGFFHGVIEGGYGIAENFVVDKNFIDETCLKGIGMNKKESARRSCNHAFGHILLVQENGDLSRALSTCDLVSGKYIDACMQGVFMENIQRENLSEHGILEKGNWNSDYLKQESSNCNKFTSTRQTECWRSLAPVITSLSQDPKRAIEVCMTAYSAESSRACTRESLGSLALSAIAYNKNGADLTGYCLYFTAVPEYEKCLGDIISYTLLTSKSYSVEMESTCNGIDPQFKNYCLGEVNKYKN